MEATSVRREVVKLLPRLRRYALILTKSADDADELVQGAVLRALDRIDQCQDAAHVDRWVFRILKTVWLNRLRAAKIRVTEPLDEVSERNTLDGGGAAEAAITVSDIQAAFERLKADQREVLFLVCMEGYSYGEAAMFLGVPIGTVMSRVSRARAELMEIMDLRMPHREIIAREIL